jgi:hypothetical protein
MADSGKAKVRLTDLVAPNAKAADSRTVFYEDSGHGNGKLGLRVSPTGHKDWVYRVI